MKILMVILSVVISQSSFAAEGDCATKKVSAKLLEDVKNPDSQEVVIKKGSILQGKILVEDKGVFDIKFN